MRRTTTDSDFLWPRLQTSDLLVLVGCCAAGLAAARWLDPYSYSNGFRTTPAWFLAHGVVPAWFGVVNLGQATLMAMHWHQRRRHPELTPIEFCGVLSTAALSALFAVPIIANQFGGRAGAGVLFLVLAAGLTTLFSTVACVVSLVRRATDRERPSWPELLAVAAAIPPGLWLPYELISSLPVC